MIYITIVFQNLHNLTVPSLYVVLPSIPICPRDLVSDETTTSESDCLPKQ